MYFLEYVWIDAEGTPRSKVRTEWSDQQDNSATLDPARLPLWNFDASSTGQNIGSDTEAILKPVRVYPSPFESNGYIVLCQMDLTYDGYSPVIDGGDEPKRGFNTRRWAEKMAIKHQSEDSWFGLEQEYTILNPVTNLPYSWKEHGSEAQGDFYCSVKYPQCQMDELIREHYQLCLKMGVKINGFNAEVLPSQWEFQVGPGDLLKIADDLVMARYVLFRLSTKYRVKITFHPKPMSGNWNGSGCHINFSTKTMREKTDKNHHDVSPMDIIDKVINNLKADHPAILEHYGTDNQERLTGEHETSSMQEFTWGVGTRNTSVRIPNQVRTNGYGYIEDRRPASNIDPYLAMGKFMEACLKN